MVKFLSKSAVKLAKGHSWNFTKRNICSYTSTCKQMLNICDTVNMAAAVTELVMRFTDRLNTTEQLKGATALFVEDDVCRGIIRVFGASCTVGTERVGSVYPCRRTHTFRSHDIRASPAQKQQVHHSGAPAGGQHPPLCVQNIISVDCDILFLLMCLLFWRTNTHPTSHPTGEGWRSPCQWLWKTAHFSLTGLPSNNINTDECVCCVVLPRLPVNLITNHSLFFLFHRQDVKANQPTPICATSLCQNWLRVSTSEG